MTQDDKGPTCLHGSEGQTYAREHFIQIKVDHVAWMVLWKDTESGEFWKEYFPQSEAHGGGPPEFIKITVTEAEAEFGPL